MPSSQAKQFVMARVSKTKGVAHMAPLPIAAAGVQDAKQFPIFTAGAFISLAR